MQTITSVVLVNYWFLFQFRNKAIIIQSTTKCAENSSIQCMPAGA